MQQKWHCLHSFSFPTHSIALAQYFHINTCTQECIIIVHIVRDQLMYLLTNEDYISLACITYCVGNFSLNILFCICICIYIYIYLQYCCIYLLWFYTKYITSDIPGLSKYLYSCSLYKREQHYSLLCNAHNVMYSSSSKSRETTYICGIFCIHWRNT